MHRRVAGRPAAAATMVVALCLLLAGCVSPPAAPGPGRPTLSSTNTVVAVAPPATPPTPRRPSPAAAGASPTPATPAGTAAPAEAAEVAAGIIAGGLADQNLQVVDLHTTLVAATGRRAIVHVTVAHRGDVGEPHQSVYKLQLRRQHGGWTLATHRQVR